MTEKHIDCTRVISVDRCWLILAYLPALGLAVVTKLIFARSLLIRIRVRSLSSLILVVIALSLPSCVPLMKDYYPPPPHESRNQVRRTPRAKRRYDYFASAVKPPPQHTSWALSFQPSPHHATPQSSSQKSSATPNAASPALLLRGALRLPRYQLVCRNFRAVSVLFSSLPNISKSPRRPVY